MQSEASIITTTLTQVVALAGGLGCLGWLLLGFPGKLSHATALRFALANLLLVVGVLLVLRRSDEVTPLAFWTDYWAADVLLIVGIACFRDGVNGLLRLPSSRRETLLVVAAFALAVALIPYPDVTIRKRGILFSITLALLVFRIAGDCLRQGDGRIARLPLRIVATVFAALGLALSVRGLGLAFWPETAVRLESTSVGGSIPFLWTAVTALLATNNALAGLVVAGLLQKIQHLATHDTLTGCLNRRALDERLRGVEERSRRGGGTFGVVMFDIDHFKRINDRHGHLAGDAVLQCVAGIMRGQLRDQGVIGRWGGEEFLILLDGADAESALATAQRLQSALATTVWQWKGESVPLAASFASDAAVAVRIDLQALDRALYRAKAAGRNCVVAVERAAPAVAATSPAPAVTECCIEVPPPAEGPKTAS
ncbi:GGDEF domain-containing protein [Thermomonas sp.]|uniref:GGDEF domain-containing protein n=1 Tax=Thermomonas sp. TaxID=1971895 RepID=UPI002CC7C52C|nr:GGDEF domain-containing protein [Thermomonas sp.]HRO62314.1 GGDEF domain-containing protein [Thermomonas sp.]